MCLSPVINDSRRRSASQQEGGHTPRSMVGQDELPYASEIVDLGQASGLASLPLHVERS